MKQLIIDGHLDLAWNALGYDRDQTLPVDQLRQRERSMTGPGRGAATVSLPELQKASVAVCMVTLLARANPNATPSDTPPRDDIDHPSQSVAYAIAQGQLAYYRLLEDQGHIKIISDVAALDQVWSSWQIDRDGQQPPIGCVICMEGADPIVDPDQLPQWQQQGLRIVSLAHYGPSAYGSGTTADIDNDKPVTLRGRQLLKHLDQLGMALDLTHTSDATFFDALDRFHGPVLASHTNCRALVPGPRQFSDQQIKRIIDRQGVIGCVAEASMLQAGWRFAESSRQTVRLDAMADHIDHICQLAGSVAHIAIGSDLDGGFGTERCPADLDTIADIQQLASILKQRGYTHTDIAAVMHNNWLRFLQRVLPQSAHTTQLSSEPDTRQDYD